MLGRLLLIREYPCIFYNCSLNFRKLKWLETFFNAKQIKKKKSGECQILCSQTGIDLFSIFRWHDIHGFTENNENKNNDSFQICRVLQLSWFIRTFSVTFEKESNIKKTKIGTLVLMLLNMLVQVLSQSYKQIFF